MDTEAENCAERDRSSVPRGRAKRSRSVVCTWWRGVCAWWPGLSLWQEVALLAIACLAVLCLVNAFLAQPFVIPSGSMENTLQIGDRVLVDKLAYRFGNQPRRGDVIVFDGTGSFLQEVPRENPVVSLIGDVSRLVGLTPPDQTDFIKRVVGIGGDRVTCCDKQGRITVNRRPVDERSYLYPGDAPSQVRFDIVVPQGKLWVMGDHRSDSSDSRDHLGDPGGGTVPVGEVIGRADWLVWPFGRAGSLGGAYG
ncbi:MAG: signal peptidase I [Streptomycetaceae bacterium]|nr:signal peptidase I [Streptomycetaceae bacterium]